MKVFLVGLVKIKIISDTLTIKLIKQLHLTYLTSVREKRENEIEIFSLEKIEALIDEFSRHLLKKKNDTQR